MSYSRIPAELRSLKQWVLWRYELVNDKQTKVPYQTNGAKADVTNSHTWNYYDNIISLVDEYSGIGLVFSTSDSYTGIDLDYDSDINIIATQLKIFSEFDSYSEISPSGMGLHIIIKGTVPAGRRKNSVEVYSSNRFFTMTGTEQPHRSLQLALQPPINCQSCLHSRNNQSRIVNLPTVAKISQVWLMFAICLYKSLYSLIYVQYV